MKILLTGSSGQIGYELQRSLQGLGEVIAVDRAQMDLSNLQQVREVIRAVKPNLIVNPAAYTAVDMAETERDLAFRINGDAPAVMAQEAKLLGAGIVHYSTDYVFDGTKVGAYEETDPTCPVNVYGASKLAGEQAIAAAGVPHLILRTSWVYGMRGKNFLLTMLRLASEQDELRVVNDQLGAPTWSRTVADTTALLLARLQGCDDLITGLEEKGGIYHLTSSGHTTWHGFAKEILTDQSLQYRPALSAIESKEYFQHAKRPKNSVLSCNKLKSLGMNLPSWQTALKLCQSA